MRIGPVLAGIGTGVGWTIQARANGELAIHTGDSVLGPFMTFAGGAVLIALASIPALAKRPPRPPGGRIPLALFTGGFFGAGLMWAQTVVVPELGMALATAAIVLGTVLTGTLSDATGFGAAGRMRISALRLVAIAALVGAVALTALRGGGIATDGATVLLVLLAFAAGVAISVQQTVNGRLRLRLGDPVVPTLLNFVVATAAVGAAWALQPNRADLADLAAAPAWAFVGAPFAALVVFASVVLAPRIGALALAATIVAGQFGGALVLDLIVPVPGHPVGPATIAAVAIALVAAGFVAVPPRRPPRHRAERA